ncbi:hypothetical protein GS444_17965 [Rhodococcus hoagii]|nr:hypothetical protein [Prescottella equi]
MIASGGFAQKTRIWSTALYPFATGAGTPSSSWPPRAARATTWRSVTGRRGRPGEGWGLMLPTVYFQRFHHWQSVLPAQSRIYVNGDGRRFMD